MGSGLIFLLIVGAWLAVLVPMALRSSEATSAHGTVDRFHDAMRVLSRRDSASQVPASPAEHDAADLRREAPVPRPARTRLTPAARRRRAVAVLVVVSLGSLLGGVLGPVWLLGVHAVADGLLLAGFLWLRSQAVLREERAWRTAMGDRRADHASHEWSPLQELSPLQESSPLQELAPAPAPVVVYGIPDRMPARREIASSDSVFDQYADAPSRSGPAPVVEPVPEVPAARGAQGAPWQPVPVPAPMYVTAPRAPRRLVDLTAPSPALSSAEHALGIDDQGPELEHILGRRAVGG